jgi:hypothetical protein
MPTRITASRLFVAVIVDTARAIADRETFGRHEAVATCWL